MFLIRKYFYWHYSYALKQIYYIGVNYALFILHFFSIALLLKTLFKPWRKDFAFYGRGFDIGKMISAFSWNIISRFLGAIVRLFTIGTGILFLALEILMFLIFLLFWFFWPALLLIGILYVIGVISFPVLI